MSIRDAPEHWPVTASAVQVANWLITVRTDQVRMPDDETASRIVVTHPGAVAILALDERNRVLMIRQYRHPVGRLLWELPAGLRDHEGESLEEVARRELREETGYAAKTWDTLVDYYSSPGFNTERIRIFLARDLVRLEDRDFEPVHEEAYLETDWVALDDAVRLVMAGDLHNGVAVAGILAGYAAATGGFATLRPAGAPEE
jgi:8-oxo-dGTP pyrophosphatase MutT (NUDIX family)